MIKHLAAALLFVTAVACKKDKDPLPRYLLKTITWNNGVTANSTYNDDILQHIEYAFQGIGGAIIFNWNGGKLKELYEDRSLYKNIYEYNNEGRLVKIWNTSKSGTLSTGYTMEFWYKSDKKLDSLKYFIINEAGKQLQAASSYHYNSAGELKEIITTSGNNIITHAIDQYSPTVSFNPCHYISTTLEENYTVYNYAVMTQLGNKLPAKVTRIVKTGSQQPYIDKIEEHTYTINNYRIDKVVTALSFPGVPANNKTVESVYTYH